MADIKILLVEKEGIFLEMVKSFLRNTGIELLVSSDYEKALDCIRSQHPDLVYLTSRDCGACLACLKAIKSDRNISSVPVVMISTKESDEYRQQCREAGCAHVLMKPVDRRAFLSSVRSFVDPEKRVNARFEAHLDVSYGFDTPDSASASSVNIGKGGMFVQVNHTFPVDTILKVRFGRSNVLAPIETRARVAWVNRLDAPIKPGMPPGMALEFLDLAPEDSARLNQYIHDEHIARILSRESYLPD